MASWPAARRRGSVDREARGWLAEVATAAAAPLFPLCWRRFVCVLTDSLNRDDADERAQCGDDDGSAHGDVVRGAMENAFGTMTSSGVTAEEQRDELAGIAAAPGNRSIKIYCDWRQGKGTERKHVLSTHEHFESIDLDDDCASWSF